MTEPIVISQSKSLHKRYLFGHISNGGGIIPFDNGKALKIISQGEDYLKIQILDYGIGVAVEGQSWVKTKKVIEKKDEGKVVKEKPESKGIVLKDKFDEEDILG